MYARNTAPVLAAVAIELRRAPSLSEAHTSIETPDAPLSPGHQAGTRTLVPRLDTPHIPAGDSSTVSGPAAAVRQALLALALKLNTVLPRAAAVARDGADRTACEHDTRLAYELSRCREGRLGSFLNSSRDLTIPGHCGDPAASGRGHGAEAASTDRRKNRT